MRNFEQIRIIFIPLSFLVAGMVVNQNSGYVTITKENITAQNVSLYRYQINTNASKTTNQMMAFKFSSSFLNSSSLELANCSQGYARVSVTINTINFELSKKICGRALEKAIYVGVKSGHGAIVEFYFKNNPNAQLSFKYGIGKCDKLVVSFEGTELLKIFHNPSVCLQSFLI